MKIIKGKWYKCLKDTRIISSKHEEAFIFLEGNLYKSEQQGFITDENGKENRMDFIPESKFLKTFKPYCHNKRFFPKSL